nr:hypothetical protein CFP56_25189 [Quercus suber]
MEDTNCSLFERPTPLWLDVTAPPPPQVITFVAAGGTQTLQNLEFQHWHLLMWLNVPLLVTSGILELALKNKNSHSKQTNVHTGDSKNFASYVEEMVTTLEHPVECANVYVKLLFHKDGTPVNTIAEGNIEKINELLSESSNRVQSSDLTGSIAWAPDDVYAQVFGNEHNGRVQDVGFGPTPSMHPAKSTSTIAQVRSQERDAKVTQLENQVASLTEKLNCYENLEERMTQLTQLVQN